MDPLNNLNSDLNDLILQHFDYNEILELSLVSQSWMCHIGESRKCMNKVKLNLKIWMSSNRQKQVEQRIELLKNLTRKYQHLSIDCRFDKNLSMEFWEVLKFLSISLTTLKIKSLKLENPSPLNLFRLKELKLVYIPINIRNILIASSNSFKKLKLKLISPLNWNKSNKSDPESLASIRKCLEVNEKLEEIEIHGGVQYSFFFDECIAGISKFRLKKLKVKTDMRLALISETCEKNLVNFLSSQSSTLEFLFIDVCRPHVIEHAFKQMKNLKSIHIETVMTDFRAKDLNLNLNERITELSIPYVNNHEDIREFLSVTPNLECLFVAHLAHETMTYIARNLSKLKTLKYRYDEIDCELLYERLRYQDRIGVNQNIEMIVDFVYK